MREEKLAAELKRVQVSEHRRGLSCRRLARHSVWDVDNEAELQRVEPREQRNGGAFGSCASPMLRLCAFNDTPASAPPA